MLVLCRMRSPRAAGRPCAAIQAKRETRRHGEKIGKNPPPAHGDSRRLKAPRGRPSCECAPTGRRWFSAPKGPPTRDRGPERRTAGHGSPSTKRRASGSGTGVTGRPAGHTPLRLTSRGSRVYAPGGIASRVGNALIVGFADRKTETFYRGGRVPAFSGFARTALAQAGPARRGDRSWRPCTPRQPARSAAGPPQGAVEHPHQRPVADLFRMAGRKLRAGPRRNRRLSLRRRGPL